jgi:hypothetical protein
MPNYTEYVLTHWEEPDSKVLLTAKDGYVSVTPEWVYEQVQSFFPAGYKEGEVTLDIPVASLVGFWKSLGGEIGVEK